MKTSIATFFAAHKTTIIIASAALVIGAKAMSFTMQNNQYEMDGGQQQMQQRGYGQMQMPQGYAQQAPQQNVGGQQGYFDSWFGGNDNEGNQAANYDGGYNTGGYTNTAGGYNGNTGGAGSTYNAGNTVDYTSGWAKQQEMQDGQHERFTDYIRDEAKYNDAEGNTYKLSSGYDYNYVNTTTNEYVQTNDASVTPGAYSNYTAVTPSDYSSSSSSSTGE